MAVYSPIGRPGQYSFEQVTQPDGTRWVWNAMVYRWEMSGGTQYNIRATQTPQQVANDLRGQNASTEEIMKAVAEQTNRLTAPAQNYQFNRGVTTALGNEILDGQSQITAETQILQQYAQGGLSTEAREAIEDSGELSRMAEYNQEFADTKVDVVIPPTAAPTPPLQRVQQPTPPPPPPSVPVPTPKPAPAPSTPAPPSVYIPDTDPVDDDVNLGMFESGRFKKIDTDLPAVTIVNTYPVSEDRNKSVSDFLTEVRRAYKKTTNGVEHKAGRFSNTINQNSGLYNGRRRISPDMPLPKPFGEIEPIEGTVIYRNLGDALTQFRFQILFTDSGNKYISKGLKDDLDYAKKNGNPYFTSHLIPRIELNKFKMQSYIESFKAEEEKWGVELYNSLSTGTQLVGEREVVRYIDSILYDSPTDLDNQFIKPYKRGTIISSHWFSQNPEGIGSTSDIPTPDIIAGNQADTDTASDSATSYGS